MFVGGKGRLNQKEWLPTQLGLDREGTFWLTRLCHQLQELFSQVTICPAVPGPSQTIALLIQKPPLMRINTSQDRRRIRGEFHENILPESRMHGVYLMFCPGWSFS